MMQTKFPTIQIVNTLHGRRYAIITDESKAVKEDKTVDFVRGVASWGRTGIGFYSYDKRGLKQAQRKLAELTTK